MYNIYIYNGSSKPATEGAPQHYSVETIRKYKKRLSYHYFSGILLLCIFWEISVLGKPSIFGEALVLCGTVCGRVPPAHLQHCNHGPRLLQPTVGMGASPSPLVQHVHPHALAKSSLSENCTTEEIRTSYLLSHIPPKYGCTWYSTSSLGT